MEKHLEYIANLRHYDHAIADYDMLIHLSPRSRQPTTTAAATTSILADSTQPPTISCAAFSSRRGKPIRFLASPARILASQFDNAEFAAS
jgi:hypothetical protein